MKGPLQCAMVWGGGGGSWMSRGPKWVERAAVPILALLLGCVAARAQAPSDDVALVARGEYLARAADCMPCHTGDRSKPYSGGLPIHTPFGTIFSVNITSDPQTGIGRWTFADFKHALHDGIRVDGAYLYPAMPFDAFTGIEEDDLRRCGPSSAASPRLMRPIAKTSWHSRSIS